MTTFRRLTSRVGSVLLLGFLVSPVQGATLRLSGTTSNQYVDQPPVPTVPCRGTLRQIAPVPVNCILYFRYWMAGTDSTNADLDSLLTQTMNPFNIQRQVPSGLYRIHLWQTFSAADVVVCDTTITRLVRGPAWRPSLDP